MLTFGALALARPAGAQSNAALAESLYQEGKRLVGERNYAAACPKFEESYKLDPATGTLLNLASCYEGWGKVATAWAHYNDALAVAKREGQDYRVEYAQARLKELEEKLTRLQIDVAPEANVPGLEVKLDDRPISSAVFGVPAPVDPGTHVIEASAPGKKPVRVEVVADQPKAVVKALVPALEDDPNAGAASTAPDGTASTAPAQGQSSAASGASPQPPDADSGTGGSGLKTAGWIAVGLGVVGLGAGTAFNLMARASAKEANEHCTGGADGNTCLDIADERDYFDNRQVAKSNATVSYVSFGVGGAALATGVVLLIASSAKKKTAESRSTNVTQLEVTPAFGPRELGVSAGGRW